MGCHEPRMVGEIRLKLFEMCLDHARNSWHHRLSEALSKSFEIMGGEVECFDNAESALKHSDIGNADCYIVDYILPGNVDGVNFLLRLHQQLHKHVCAVMMSGNTSTYFIRNAEFFSWPVVHKPVNISKLISKLSEQYSKNV